MTATTDPLTAVGRAGGANVCKGYSYAGLQGGAAVAGVRATVKVVKTPEVREGHVGGWIGIGGPGLGPGGTDQWLQAGYSGFADGTLQMYWEITLPREAPAYHVLKQQAVRGEAHTISILEVNGK